MDRRFVAWLLLTASLFLLWTSLRPKVNPVDANKPKPKVSSPREETSVGGRDATSVTPEVEPSKFTGSLSKHVLGTLVPEDRYRLMVTLTSKGAGIERVELVEQTKPGRFKYRDLEGEGGYLGYLSLAKSDSGLMIQSVPAGSPAALAKSNEENIPMGLMAGDRIVKVDEKVVENFEQWHEIFQPLKAGHNAEIKIVRGEKENAKELTFTTELIQKPMDVVRMSDDRIHEQVVGNFMRESCLTTLAQVDKLAIASGESSIEGLEEILDGYWEPRSIDVPGGMGLEFVLPIDHLLAKTKTPGKLELVKQYRLVARPSDSTQDWIGYDIDFKTIVRNTDSVPHQVALRQESFNGLTLEGWWYLSKISPFMFEGAGSRDVVYSSEGLGHNMLTRRSIFSGAQENPDSPDRLFVTSDMPSNRRKFNYLGVDAQFFAAVIAPHRDQPDSMSEIQQAASTAIADVNRIPSAKQIAMNVGAWFDTPSVTLEPNQEFVRQYRLFAGPKDPGLLAEHKLDSLLEYGWFGWVAKPLTMILHTFYAVARNYGIAIIMLTVLVRSSMFPLSRNAAINAQKMQEVAPELKRINELYKDDWDKRTKATQEVYKKSNFNPMAGCLPLFIQIPIFIGLYRAVSVDIQLRQQPLIPGLDWCSNLAGPDMLLDWSSWMPDMIAGKGTGWFGPYLNLLPIITICLFIIQQKVLMPKATDEQQQMTQTMMMWMTVFMGVLFFKVPAGLCIYFITSSTWSLVERRLVKRLTPAPKKGAESVTSIQKSNDEKYPVKSSDSNSNRKEPRVISNRSQRPEKLSDVFPWMRRFEARNQSPDSKEERKNSDGPGSNRRKKRK